MIENSSKLQSALTALQEKHTKLQLKTDNLNAENERLVNGRSDLLAEVNRLQEQQIKLRERNLQLTQEYYAKQKECSLLAEKVAVLAREHTRFKSSSAMPNDKLDDSSSLTKHTHSDPNLPSMLRQLDTVRQSWWTAQMLGIGLSTNADNKDTTEKNDSELTLDFENKLSPNAEEEIISYVKQCRHKVLSLKTLLLSHKTMLRKLCENVKSNPKHSSSTQTIESLSQIEENLKKNAVLELKTEEEQICPLCEAQFYGSSDEDLQNHVVDHFKSDNRILSLF